MQNTWFLSTMDHHELPHGVRYPHIAAPENVVSRYIERYSRQGQLVFDPFAGYGSTLRVAQRLGRRAFGVEIDSERLEYASRHLEGDVQLVSGDSKRLKPSDLPDIHFCFTGLPFFASARLMNVDIPCLGASYDEYLADLASIFDIVNQRLAPGGYVVTLTSNFQVGRSFFHSGSAPGLFTQAWDTGKCIAKVIPLVAEEIWCISKGTGLSPFAGQHGYFLIFRKPQAN